MTREPHRELLDLSDRIVGEREHGVLLGVGREDLAVVARHVRVREVAAQRDADGEVLEMVGGPALGDPHDVGLGLAVMVVAEDDRHP